MEINVLILGLKGFAMDTMHNEIEKKRLEFISTSE